MLPNCKRDRRGCADFLQNFIEGAAQEGRRARSSSYSKPFVGEISLRINTYETLSRAIRTRASRFAETVFAMDPVDREGGSAPPGPRSPTPLASGKRVG